MVEALVAGLALNWTLISESHEVVQPRVYLNSSVHNGGPNPLIVQQHSVTDEQPFRIWGDTVEGIVWASWLTPLIEETRSVTEVVPQYSLFPGEVLYKEAHWRHELGHQRYSRSGPSPEAVRYRSTHTEGDIVHYKS
jgi:hypothetical protein